MNKSMAASYEKACAEINKSREKYNALLKTLEIMRGFGDRSQHQYAANVSLIQSLTAERIELRAKVYSLQDECKGLRIEISKWQTKAMRKVKRRRNMKKGR